MNSQKKKLEKPDSFCSLINKVMKSRHCGWSELPSDIIFLIINQKQLSMADIGRMTTVCKSWGSMIQINHWFGLHVNANIGKTPFPWLMLSECSTSNGGGNSKRGFFNPATRQISEILLPEAEGRWCCGSSHGWIITIGKDMEIKLLNPLTRQQHILPSQLTFKVFTDDGDDTTNEEIHSIYSREVVSRSFIQKAILTSSPAEPNECFTVALLTLPTYPKLAFAKLGDSKWTIIPHVEDCIEAEDFIFFQNHLFAINSTGALMVLDLYHDSHLLWKVISPSLIHTCSNMLGSLFYAHYLVEIAGEFTVVARVNVAMRNVGCKKVKVLVFKLRGGEWCKIDNIGEDCCLFLGTNQGICLSPVPRGYYSNCIYFADCYPYRGQKYTATGEEAVERHMLVYSMADDSYSPFYVGASLSKCSPSLWITLNSSE